MEELHFTGNCLKGSRSVLSFDRSFDAENKPHLPLIRELLTQVFGVPKTSRKIKPFIDHVIAFTLADGRIWIRNYQISETDDKNTKNPQQINGEQDDEHVGATTTKKAKREGTRLHLVEIGPRFVLTPIVILESSFGGPVIYENKEFVSPNQIRSDLRRARSGKFNRRSEGQIERKAKKGDLGLMTEGGRRIERDALDERELFA